MMRALLLLSLFVAPVLAQDAAQDVAAKEAPANEAKKAETKKAEAKEEIARIAEIPVNFAADEDPYAANPFGATPRNFLGFMTMLKEVANDPSVDGVLLKLQSAPVGTARLMELRDALMQLRKGGKKVFLFKEGYDARDLILASAADHVSMPETGMVVLPGLAIEMMYMKGLLDKLRIKFDVIHIGDFKTAGESMVKDKMSEEQRKSLAPILDEFYNSMVKAIADGRGLEVEAVKKAIDHGMFQGAAAKKAGLVDRIEYRDQFIESMKAAFPGKRVLKTDKYARNGGAKIDPNNPMAAMTVLMQALMGGTPKKKEAPGPRVAVIYCTGQITSGPSQYDWTGNIASMGSDTIVKAIDKARKDENVKAIVLRVNSPGGSALASDMIWRAVARAKTKKPVIASMGDVAASGGYYISMNSDAIFAEPQTITGSIGVVGMVPNMDEFWPWVGISMERMTRGKRAAAFMTSKGMSDEDKAVLRESMKTIYGDFVGKVAAGRGRTPAEIEPFAQGRVWTGRDALKHGLVDRLGGLRDAIAFAKDKAGLAGNNEVKLVELPRRGGPLEALEKMFGGAAEMTGIELEMLKSVPALRKALLKIAGYQRISVDRIAVLNPEVDALANPFGGASR